MAMSPRQIAALIGLGGKRQKRAMAREMVTARLAAHGDKREVEKALKDWTRE